MVGDQDDKDKAPLWQEPERPPLPSKSMGWTDKGDMVSQQASALAWVKEQDRRRRLDEGFSKSEPALERVETGNTEKATPELSGLGPHSSSPTPAPTLEDEVQRADEAARAAARGRQDRIERADDKPALKPEPVKEGPQPEITPGPSDRIEAAEPSLDDEVQRAEEAAREAARGQRDQIGRDANRQREQAQEFRAHDPGRPAHDPTAAAAEKQAETRHQKASKEEDEKAALLREIYGDDAARLASKFPPGTERAGREQGARGGRSDDDDGGRGNER